MGSWTWEIRARSILSWSGVGEEERERFSEGGERDYSLSLYQSSALAFYFRILFKAAPCAFSDGGILLTCFLFRPIRSAMRVHGNATDYSSFYAPIHSLSFSLRSYSTNRFSLGVFGIYNLLGYMNSATYPLLALFVSFFYARLSSAADKYSPSLSP